MNNISEDKCMFGSGKWTIDQVGNVWVGQGNENKYEPWETRKHAILGNRGFNQPQTPIEARQKTPSLVPQFSPATTKLASKAAALFRLQGAPRKSDFRFFRKKGGCVGCCDGAPLGSSFSGEMYMWYLAMTLITEVNRRIYWLYRYLFRCGTKCMM